jgi:predicted transcriptional regulator of viral defense system
VKQHGYVTTHDVSRIGIPEDVVTGLVDRGHLVVITQGLYWLHGAPQTRWRALAEAVFRVGPGAALSHDAVLALHELVEHKLDRIRVSNPHPVRVHLPNHIEVYQHRVEATDLIAYRGIPSTTIARALLDCRSLLTAELLVHAADGAVERGLLLRRERHAVVEALEAGI